MHNSSQTHISHLPGHAQSLDTYERVTHEQSIYESLATPLWRVCRIPHVQYKSANFRIPRSCHSITHEYMLIILTNLDTDYHPQPQNQEHETLSVLHLYWDVNVRYIIVNMDIIVFGVLSLSVRWCTVSYYSLQYPITHTNPPTIVWIRFRLISLQTFAILLGCAGALKLLR